LVLVVFAAGCSKSSDTSSSSAASAAPVEAATTAAAMGAAATSAAASSDTSATTDEKTGLPVYPGATSAASGANAGQAGTVLTTEDSFDKVYAWYKDHMPAGSEKAKLSAGGMSNATFETEKDGGKEVVAITSQGGKTTISLAKTTQ
jgi:hypothetical protein